MIVLREFKFLQKLMGLNPGVENIAVRLVYLFVLSSCTLMLSLFSISNFHNDIYGALGVLPTIAGFAVLVVNYLQLLISREPFNSLLNELQNIVNESMKLPNGEQLYLIDFPWFIGEEKGKSEKIYVKATQKASFATKIIIYGSLWVPILSISPFLLAAYHWCLGIYTLDSWILFFPVWYDS